ncbi:MAG TPA: helix-turn-helix domain-containing protein [Dehalococcoidia bacterium]|nr:helix-turn-helix domain-containing protein [Dehalococcoidia bacterium]
MAPSTGVDRGQRGEQAKAARREEILDAARRVFAARGFRGTTIADIADEAGIALGTIYLYFPSKEAVFGALNQRLGVLIAEALRSESPAVSLEDTVARRVRATFAACASNRDLVRLFVLNTDPGSAVERRIRAQENTHNRPMAIEIAQGIADGTIRRCDPAIAVRLVYGVVRMAVYEAFVVGDGSHADAYRDACAAMIAAYLRPEPAS